MNQTFLIPKTIKAKLIIWRSYTIFDFIFLFSSLFIYIIFLLFTLKILPPFFHIIIGLFYFSTTTFLLSKTKTDIRRYEFTIIQIQYIFSQKSYTIKSPFSTKTFKQPKEPEALKPPKNLKTNIKKQINNRRCLRMIKNDWKGFK